jgi:NAD(P)-dependent dehydrogenase (short-subunit alcohol dehydrogenase family)
MSTAKPVALITGGAKGIGRAIARHLASSGWQLGILDLPEGGLRRAYPRDRSVLTIEGDVRMKKPFPTRSRRSSIDLGVWTPWSRMPAS